MKRNNLQARLTWGIGIVCVCLAGISLVNNARTAQFDEDDILKLKDMYPRREEYPYLPAYCQVKTEELLLHREGRELPPDLARARQAWTNRLGKTTWLYLHHYCAGIIQIKRFEESVEVGIGSIFDMTKKQKQCLVTGLRQWELVEPRYRKAGSPLYAPTVVYHVKTLHLLGRTQEAMAEMTEGIAADPANDVLYLGLAQTLLELGNKKQAENVLELGYKRTNGSKRISKMLAGLK